MFQDGQTLGDFEILGRLGQGGMGAVYQARQTSLDRIVALKTLQASLAGDPEYIARFRREAKAAAGLNHPNLVQVYAAGENDGLHWFAMEYVEGESAQDRLKRKGRLDPAEAIAIAVHIATALDYGWRKAHLIHRDIKPDNIFLSSDGEVKLGDLGLAKHAGETQSLTMTGASMGTPHYMSPEQAEGKKDVDLRADIYSLGCALFHLVAGKQPYQGDTALAVMMKHVTAPVPEMTAAWPGSPGELSRVVLKMMQKDPAARQQSYAEVIADLRRAYDALTGETVPDTVAVTQQGEARDRRFSTAGEDGGIEKTAVENRRSLRKPLGIGGVALLAALAALFHFAPWKKGGGLTEAERAEKAREMGSACAPRAVSGAPPETAGVANAPHSATPSGNERTTTPDAPGGAPGTAREARALPEAAVPPATKDKPFVNTLGMRFVPVPIVSGPSAGQRVLFGVWDVRVQDYAAYACANPMADGGWKTQHKEGVPAGRELDHPVVGVSWEDAQAFCQWLTEKETAEGKLAKGVKYRLPSDEEWSWAVALPPEVGATPEEKHGKNSVDFPWGKDWPPVKKVGNYADETFHAKFPPKQSVKDDRMENEKWMEGYTDGFATTSPVGSFPANAYGLYDMGGNVWQWCEDWYDASHKDRVIRGASWIHLDRGFLLSSLRSHGAPGRRICSHGFRCAVGVSAR